MKLLLFLLIVIYLSNCSDPQSSNITVDFPKQKFLIKNKSLEHYLDSFIIRKCKTKSDALLLIITNDESQSLIRLKVVYNASNMRAQFITDYKGKKLFIVIPNLTNIFEFNNNLVDNTSLGLLNCAPYESLLLKDSSLTRLR